MNTIKAFTTSCGRLEKPQLFSYESFSLQDMVTMSHKLINQFSDPFLCAVSINSSRYVKISQNNFRVPPT